MITNGETSRIADMINSMAFDVRALLKSAIEISYFSRSAVKYGDVLNLSALERDLWVEFINKRLEVAGKSPFPIY